MSPPDGATDVSLNPRYQFHFDEPVNPISFTETTNTSVSFAADNRQLLYTRHQPLAAGSEHTETVAAVADIAGNTVISNSTTFRTTDQPDVTSPVLSNYVPESNATVPVNTLVRLHMSEVVDPLSVTDSGVYVRDITNSGTTVPSSVSVDADGRTLIWAPDEALTINRQYQIHVNGVADLSGNTANNHWHYFYTSLDEDLTAPVVVATTVSEGQTGVPINGRLRVRFDEPMDVWTQDRVTLTAAGELLPVNASLSSDRRLLTLTPRQLLPTNTDIVLNITGITDLSGHAVADQQIGFTTASGVDVLGGTITAYSPASDMRDVPLNAVIEFRTSERIDPTTLTGYSYI